MVSTGKTSLIFIKFVTIAEVLWLVGSDEERTEDVHSIIVLGFSSVVFSLKEIENVVYENSVFFFFIDISNFCIFKVNFKMIFYLTIQSLKLFSIYLFFA